MFVVVASELSATPSTTLKVIVVGRPFFSNKISIDFFNISISLFSKDESLHSSIESK